MNKIAIFPGSFDPLTNGHLDLIKRAAKLFDKVIVAVLSNTAKQPLFSMAERLSLIKQVVADLDNVTVIAQSDDLTVNVAHQLHAQFIIRGLRSSQDFEYENNIAQMNSHLADDIETVFLLTKPRYAYIASSLVKEVARFHGDLDHLVPKCIANALIKKFN